KLYVVGVTGGLRKEVGALIVHTPPERHCPGFGPTFREVMSTENVSHCIAVRYDVAFEFPRIAQLIDQQKGIRTSRLAVYPVVGTHDRSSLAFGDRGAEGGEIGILHVMLGDLDVDAVTGGLGPAMDRIVLGGGDNAVILGIISLQSSDKSYSHASRQEGIFT